MLFRLQRKHWLRFQRNRRRRPGRAAQCRPQVVLP